MENTTGWGKRIGYAIEIYVSRGERFKFVTLTSHESLYTRKQTERVFPLAWGKLYDRLRRKHKGTLIYVSIPERHKDGRMHAHLITNADIDTRWVKDNARECGFGYQADVQDISDTGQIIAYVIKYMRKSVGKNSWSKGFRRIRTSHKLPKAPANESSGEWSVMMLKAIYVMLARYAGEGYELVGADEGTISQVVKYL